MHQFRFTAASNAIADEGVSWSKLLGIDDSSDNPDQFARFTVQSDASNAASGKMALALVHNTLGVLAYHIADVVPNGRRTKQDGTSSGKYVCDVFWDQSGNSIFDISGSVDEIPAGEGGGTLQWYVGFVLAGDLTAINMQAHYGKRV